MNHLFEIEKSDINVKVFTVNFDQSNASTHSSASFIDIVTTEPL